MLSSVAASTIIGAMNGILRLHRWVPDLGQRHSRWEAYNPILFVLLAVVLSLGEPLLEPRVAQHRLLRSMAWAGEGYLAGVLAYIVLPVWVVGFGPGIQMIEAGFRTAGRWVAVLVIPIIALSWLLGIATGWLGLWLRRLLRPSAHHPEFR